MTRRVARLVSLVGDAVLVGAFLVDWVRVPLDKEEHEHLPYKEGGALPY